MRQLLAAQQPGVTRCPCCWHTAARLPPTASPPSLPVRIPNPTTICTSPPALSPPLPPTCCRWHSYCPPQFLEWSYRAPKIIEELLRYDADILCLQEVGPLLRCLVPLLVACPPRAGCRHSMASVAPRTASGRAVLYASMVEAWIAAHPLAQVERPFYEGELVPTFEQRGYEVRKLWGQARCL